MIAAYAMRGRMQAIQMAVLFFVLSILMPPLSIIGSAVVGLVVLRQGTSNGWQVGLGASLVTGLAAWLLVGAPSFAVASLLFWLPLLLLGALLRYSGSLSLTVQAGMAIGLLPLVLESIFLGPGSGGWAELLEPLRQSLGQAGVMEADQLAELMDWLARWLGAMIAAGLYLQICIALFVARGWQARLYNPGGFGKEFRELRLSRTLAWLGGVVLLLLLLANGAQWALLRLVLVLLLVAFFLQGLAVLHALLGRSPAGRGWIFGMYALLLLALPYMGLTLAATGYVDAWRDFRRSGKQAGPEPQDRADDD